MVEQIQIQTQIVVYSLIPTGEKEIQLQKNILFFSNRHKSYSRIDFVLISEQLMPLVQSIEIKHMTMSDPHAYICQLSSTDPSRTSTRWRFNLTLLENEDFCKQFEKEIVEFIMINKQSVLKDDRYLWDAIKGFIRINAQTFTSQMKKINLNKIKDLESSISKTELHQQTNYTEETAKTLSRTKMELNLILTQMAEAKTHRVNRNKYIYGECLSRILANKLKSVSHVTNIASIVSETGDIISDPKLINQSFSDFYKKLYTSDDNSSDLDKDTYLDNLNLTTLTNEESLALEAPFTLEELRQALTRMNKGKSPGIDGIQPEVYLKFWQS